MSISAGARRDRETVETLDSVYLNEALEALLEAGAPAYLYAGAEEGEAPEQRAYAIALVKTRRIKSCRRSALYAAFAAEAFINSFIAATLSTRDRERIDRNRTVDKYVLGPSLAVRDDLSELEQRGELEVLERLFTLRNRLVHPKPRQLAEIQRVGADRWRYDEYKPSKAAAFVATVGAEAHMLSELHDAVPLSTTAYLVVLNKERILEFGRRTDTAPERGAESALTMEMLGEALAERFGLGRGEAAGNSSAS
jgi:hypothetical protein